MASKLQRSLLALFVSAFVCSDVCLAQNREKFVISAKAGGINAVTGRAKVHLKGGTEWQPLTVTDDLEAGDIVRTELGARVEMLLNPGSYLRLGENSEFELVNNSLENLEVRLIRGTAIVEATGGDQAELLINISTPHAKLAIVRHGLYRLNVIPEDATELIVRKGRVMLNDSQKVKGGHKVIFSGGTPAVAKLQGEEKKDRDDIDFWSKGRAETLAKANRRISDRTLLSAYRSISSSDWLFGSGRRLGFWFYSARSNCYTFVPFSLGWGSPYGGAYSAFNPYFCCQGNTNRNPSVVGNPNGNVTGGGGATGGGGSTGGYRTPSSGDSRTAPPPNPRPIDRGDTPTRGSAKGDRMLRPEQP